MSFGHHGGVFAGLSSHSHFGVSHAAHHASASRSSQHSSHSLAAAHREAKADQKEKADRGKAPSGV
jgi:hypothetical protein